jgi:hypothetical protein
MYRFSKASLAPRRTCFDFQSTCASMKSIPCFGLVDRALLGIELEFHAGLVSHFEEKHDHLCIFAIRRFDKVRRQEMLSGD